MRKLLCLLGLHGSSYKLEAGEQSGQWKRTIHVVKFCPYCPNGRKIIVTHNSNIGI